MATKPADEGGGERVTGAEETAGGTVDVTDLADFHTAAERLRTQIKLLADPDVDASLVEDHANESLEALERFRRRGEAERAELLRTLARLRAAGRHEWVSRAAALAGLASAAGLVVFGALRGAYATFYGSYSVAPEELGFAQLEVLSRSATALLLTLVLAVIAVGIYIRWLQAGSTDTSTGWWGFAASGGVAASVFLLRWRVLGDETTMTGRTLVVIAAVVSLAAALSVRSAGNNAFVSNLRKSLLVFAALIFPSMWIGWIYATALTQSAVAYAPASEIIAPNVFIRSVCYSPVGDAGGDNSQACGLLLGVTDNDYIVHSRIAGCDSTATCIDFIDRDRNQLIASSR